jgi:hypothetical protein
MKKIIIIVFFNLLSNAIFGQDNNFPRYYIQNGDTIGVIYSIDQAQKIYNTEVLLELFKGVRLGCDSLKKKYFMIVNKYEQKQIVDKTMIDFYEKNLKDNQSIIARKDDKIDNLNLDLKKCGEQLTLKTAQYQNDEEIIVELKKHRSWLLGGTIGFGSLSLFLLGAVLLN